SRLPATSKAARRRATSCSLSGPLRLERTAFRVAPEPEIVGVRGLLSGERKEREHDLRRRAPVSGGNEGTIRGVDRGRAPERREPAGGPDLPRGRAVGRWLDDRRNSRLPGELGTIPQRDGYAADVTRDRRWLYRAAPGDNLLDSQPADRLREK